MTTAPVSHVENSMKLTSDGLVTLWEITLRDNTKVYLHNGAQQTWQGKVYESMPIMLTGEEESSDDKTNKPSLKIFNPAKVFGPMAHQGKFEMAIVVRRRLLVQHLVSNTAISQAKVWRVQQIVSCTSRHLDVLLGSPTDGPNTLIPNRFYAPPEFPTVSI